MKRTEKYCGGCRVVKPKTEFYKNPQGNDGLAAKCKTCSKRYAEKYRAKNPLTEKQKAKQRAYNIAYRMRKREQINSRRRAARKEAKRIEEIRRSWS